MADPIAPPLTDDAIRALVQLVESAEAAGRMADMSPAKALEASLRMIQAFQRLQMAGADNALATLLSGSPLVQ